MVEAKGNFFLLFEAKANFFLSISEAKANILCYRHPEAKAIW